MKQRIIGKALAVTVIILFLSVAVQPAIATVEPEKQSDDDCDLCPKKVSKKNIDRLITLMDRIEKYDNQLSALSKLNPEIEEKYQEISDNIRTLTEMRDEYNDFEWDFSILCFFPTKIWEFNWYVIMLGIYCTGKYGFNSFGSNKGWMRELFDGLTFPLFAFSVLIDIVLRVPFGYLCKNIPIWYGPVYDWPTITGCQKHIWFD